MRFLALVLLLAACRPDDSAGQPVPDFAGNLGPTAPDMASDMARDLVSHILDLDTPDGGNQ